MSGASNTLIAGLRLHPKSGPLWELYLETQLEQVRRGAGSADEYQQLLKQLEEAARLGTVSSYQSNYFRALLYERLGKMRESLDAYENALASADRPQDRIRARSKVSELRTRVATGAD